MAQNPLLLKALTPEAHAALKGPYIAVDVFPFRVGRECRITYTERQDSRRSANSSPNNDLYLLEQGHVLNVSREHFLIDRTEEGFVLVDRGSSCGTLVEGDLVGNKKKGGQRRLYNNDVIIVGTSESKYVFKVTFPERV